MLNVFGLNEGLYEVPMVYETHVGETLVARAEQMDSYKLGPPDLCHVVMKDADKKVVGFYHSVSGIETSSSMRMASYISYLKYFLESKHRDLPDVDAEERTRYQQLMRGKQFQGGIICSYHPFERMDVRVDVRMPLSIKATGVFKNKMINLCDDEQDDLFWSQLHVSSVLRTLIDRKSYPPKHTNMYRAPIFEDQDSESRFFLAFKKTFSFFPKLGCDPYAEEATLTFNVMVNEVIKFFGHDCGRWDKLITLWSDLIEFPGVSALLAESLMENGMDGRAIKVIMQGLTDYPFHPCILHIFTKFLLKKEKYDDALVVATKLCSVSALSFRSWSILISCYLAKQNYSMSLACLNSTPTFAFRDQEQTKFPLVFQELVAGESDRTMYQGTVEYEKQYNERIKPNFKKHMRILGLLVQKATWEELLKHRSLIFYMESDTNHEHKRLCEHWLSYLFDLMYKDLVSFSILEESVQDSRTEQDWEFMGDFFKLNLKMMDAVRAYQHSVMHRYSPRVLIKLIKLASKLFLIKDTIQAISHLFSFPGINYMHLFKITGDPVLLSPVSHGLFRLIRKHGLRQVRSNAVELSLKPSIYSKINVVFEFSRINGYPGFDS